MLFHDTVGLSWLDQLGQDLSSGSGRVRVPHGSSFAENWSLGCGPSPVEEVLQDSIWSEEVTDVVGNPGRLFSGFHGDELTADLHKQLASANGSLPDAAASMWSEDVLSSNLLTTSEVNDPSLDDLFMGTDLTSDLEKPMASNSSSSSYTSPYSSLFPTSPLDVQFESGDILGSFAAEQSVLFESNPSIQASDYSYTRIAQQKIDYNASIFNAPRPNFTLGSLECLEEPFFTDVLENVSHVVGPADSIVPEFEASVSPFDSLDRDSDSLHDAESVCEILRALEGSAHSFGTKNYTAPPVLNQFSPEEVESVLSRDSSSDNLAALEDSFQMESESVSVFPKYTLMGSPISTISPVSSSCGSALVIPQVSGQINVPSIYTPISTPMVTIAATSAALPGANFTTISIPSSIGLELPKVATAVGNIIVTSSVPSTLAVGIPTSSGIVSAPTLIGLVPGNGSPVVSASSVIGSDYQDGSLIGKQAMTPRAIRPNTLPYANSEVLHERKERKKEQNKSAALKYRQRKRAEKGHAVSEVEELEEENAQLKNRAAELTKEINYLRGLLEEITKP